MSEAEGRLTRTDSILEPNVIHHLKAFIALGGGGSNQQRVRDAIDLVSKSYRGTPHMVNLLEDLLVITGEESIHNVQSSMANTLRKLAVQKYDAQLVDKATQSTLQVTS